MDSQSRIELIVTADASGAIRVMQQTGEAVRGVGVSTQGAQEPAGALGQAFAGLGRQALGATSALQSAALAGAALGTALTAAVLVARNSIAAFTALATTTRDLAFVSGGSAEQISGLLDVLEDFGVESSTVQQAMVFLSRAVQDGSPSLDRLGISIRTASGHLKTAHDLFYETIDRLRLLRSETERNSIAQELYGRGWTAMVPIVEQGSAALKEAAENSKLLMTQDDIRRADEYRRAIADLGDQWERLKMTIGRGIVAPITITVKVLADLGDVLNALIRPHAGVQIDEAERRRILEQIDPLGRLRAGLPDRSASDVGAWRMGAPGAPVSPWTAPAGETPGEKAARERREAEARRLAEARAKLEEEIRAKSLAGWVAYAEAVIALDQKAAMAEVENLQAVARAREASRAQALENEYESLKAQQAIIDEARTLGIRFYEDDAKRFLELEREAARQAEETARIAHQEMLQRRADLEAVLALEREALDIRRQQYEGAFAGLFGVANAVGGEAGKGLGMFAAGFKGIADLAAGEDKWTQEYNRAEEHWLQMQMLYEEHLVSEEAMHAASLQRQVAQDRMYEQQRVALWQSSAQMGAGAMLALYNLTGQKHKEFFVAFQAMKIAETLINTYSAAVGAYNAMASIPYVGPALGAAAAAAAIAFGMAQVAAIASMKPGGGGAATAAAPSGGAGYAYAQPTRDQWEREAPEAERPMAVTINVYGSLVDHDQFAREIVPALRKAQADGQR